MNSFSDRQWYSIFHGAPYETISDLYRAKYGLPLTESPERFLAGRPPLRKNKDYRPRFRNFVIGFPVRLLLISRYIRKTTIPDTGITY
jgi:hypothetical protein